MQFKLDVDHLYKEDKKEEKDMYSVNFEVYNGKVEGKFERSEIRHIIQIFDNAIE